jgi:hypothetical protein
VYRNFSINIYLYITNTLYPIIQLHPPLKKTQIYTTNTLWPILQPPLPRQKKTKNKNNTKTRKPRKQIMVGCKENSQEPYLCAFIYNKYFISNHPTLPPNKKNENKNEKNHTHKSHKTNQVTNKQILFGCIEFSQKIYIYIQQIHQNKLSSSQRSMIPL